MKYHLRESPGFDLLRTAGLFKSSFAKQLRPHGVTPVQFAVLGLLWDRDGVFQHEIAEALHKDRPNVTRILEKMESKGWVKRQKSTQDKRSICVFLTNQGLKLKDQLEPLALSFRKSAFENLSSQEIQQLRYLLSKTMDNFL